ncbi:aromatic amino acid DMT transporter YddG [Pantoea allii]|uniref:Aromatic amino acid DMT transporter YddG n=1 Tax=Pantoea allii TaxID=574096 RepID=A0ABS6VB59_9GAMM|nr:aromatic amino acid DMT transporter YddG [Pantoea allii]MBW1212042.1 aromatic amino acid DMT transporter YddG [Pantoea allii]MBW1256320.1 aromatic amino acid DMT transporter YddG [Pantoea allii]MBW1265397.1 aromatic amino acid DMT transporter YddG [Pantoea allii]MBW1287514.1 aromatic amino acid DMT transporter YddG [Pantoea allii]
MPANLPRATLVGLSAILLWSTTIGLLRSVSEAFGPTGGAALIYSTTAVLLCLTRGVPNPRNMPGRYLLTGGVLFVGYEICLALAVGLARDRHQSLEMGMINYLWPCLTIVLAIPFNQQRFRLWLWPGLLLSLSGIIWVMKGANGNVTGQMVQNIASNPTAYLLAFIAAIAWALYNNITRRYARGSNGVTLFFMVTALALWLKFALFTQHETLQFSVTAAAEVLFMGASTAVAYSAWNYGIQHGNLTLLATASYFTPVLSALLASLWLGLTPPISFWQGVAMITAGSLICWLATRR